VSRKIRFGTGELIGDAKAPALLGSMKQIQVIYMKRGFRITEALMDGQFECLRGDLSAMGILLNTVSVGEHVPEAERYIRTVKERMRCMFNSVPFERMPALMIREMVRSSVLWLNSFPPKDGVSAKMSPRLIVVGVMVDFK
jgi:hypothetical protein